MNGGRKNEEDTIFKLFRHDKRIDRTKLIHKHNCDRAAVIENCKQIVECSEIMAKVLTGSFEIEIWGSGLTMSNFCSDSVEIRGKIESVKLVSRSIRERG